MPIQITPTIADYIKEFFEHRGGVKTWDSENLADPGKNLWFGPGDNQDPPRCYATNPVVHTDPAEFEVVVLKEVNRFPVSLRPGDINLSIRLTDASSRRLLAARQRAGEGASFQFDYTTQEAVIYVPERATPLPDYYKL